MEKDVRLAVLTGSFAAGVATDSFSDLDIELYVRDDRSLLRSAGWYRQFGDVLVVEALPSRGWHPTRLVYYVGGKIDFMIARESALDRGITYSRPYRVLVDKDGLGRRLSKNAVGSGNPPTERDYLRCVNWFYAAALMCAKCVVRRDPWAAKYRDWDLKCQLLLMITWDHKVRYGWDYDTRFRGRRLRDWADDDVAQDLAGCWGTFSEESIEAALMASVKLFERLNSPTASALGVDPFDSTAVQAEICRILRSVPGIIETDIRRRART